MACTIATSGKVVLLVWGKPEVKDLDAISAAVDATVTRCGPIVLVARVPAGAAAPDEQLRKQIAARLPSLVDRCASYHAVLEGNGFFNAAKRAALATMFLMSGRRNRYHVHANVSEVVDSVALPYVSEVTTALRQFQPLGLLHRNQPSLYPAAPAA